MVLLQERCLISVRLRPASVQIFLRMSLGNVSSNARLSFLEISSSICPSSSDLRGAFAMSSVFSGVTFMDVWDSSLLIEPSYLGLKIGVTAGTTVFEVDGVLSGVDDGGVTKRP